MQITLEKEHIEALKKKGAKSKVILEHDRWRLTTDTDKLKEDWKLILKVMKSKEFKDTSESRKNVRLLNAVMRLLEAGVGATKLKNLKLLVEAIKTIMEKAERQWIFVKDDNYGQLVAYYVEKVQYVPYSARGGDRVKSHIDIKLKAVRRGHHDSETVQVFRDDLLKGKTAYEVMADKGLIVEDEGLIKAYDEELATYRKYMIQTGEQFSGSGEAYSRKETEDDDLFGRRTKKKGYSVFSSWGNERIILDHAGSPAKLVMDDMIGQGDHASVGTSEYNVYNDEEENYRGDEDIDFEDGDEEQDQIQIPVHPICKVFDLRMHQYLTVHVNNIKPYEFNKNLGDKLVLPPEHRELIGALTSSVMHYMEDIVAGKASGIIILCSGTPGTGKTLTSEVYSEIVGRPLYVVQCSQLGTSAKSLEDNLQEVLNRATRWNAILLIDESDVYIHERGSDVDQNAIVGVFLRLLEYFNGMLFLTTNRATVVDDAIISRLTAHIRYGTPRKEDRKKLWQVLAPQFGVDPTDELVDTAIEKYPNISGRSIRQLLKLSAFMAAARQKPVTIEMIDHAVKFHDFNEEEKVGIAKE